MLNAEQQNTIYEIRYTNFMAGNFSFDIVSDYDKAELNNVVDQAKREIANRYDLKDTKSSLDWVNDTKTAPKSNRRKQLSPRCNFRHCAQKTGH